MRNPGRPGFRGGEGRPPERGEGGRGGVHPLAPCPAAPPPLTPPRHSLRSRGEGNRDAMKIRAEKDFWSGVMFLGFALVATVAARGYSMGSGGKMGPGYFPMLLGVALAGLGALLVG